jgi:hypothetical protein
VTSYLSLAFRWYIGMVSPLQRQTDWPQNLVTATLPKMKDWQLQSGSFRWYDYVKTVASYVASIIMLWHLNLHKDKKQLSSPHTLIRNNFLFG